MAKNNNIPYDGFGNVIEMLKVSDPVFREKILRNIAQRDRGLAERLLLALRQQNSRPAAPASDNYSESLDRLERSQRAHHTKNYGN